MRIREAREKDVDAILELVKKLADYHRRIDKDYRPGKKLPRGYKNRFLEIIRKKNSKIVVAENGGKIVGYFSGKIEKAKPYLIFKRMGKISNAFIEEGYRGKGIGKKMLDFLIKWFKKKGIECVEVSVDLRNKIGVNFWKKSGFKGYIKKMKLKL